MSRKRKSPYLRSYQYAGEQHPRNAGIYISLITSQAWYALKDSSKDVYLQLIAKMNMDDDYVFFYRNELKKVHINPKTYLRALDDLIYHGFIKVVGYMYMSEFKPTVCLKPTDIWRNWTGNLSLDEFIKLYVPAKNTRKGNMNFSLKPNKHNKIIDLTEELRK
ncbi:MAG: hypothetical protein LKE46_14575 [Clostridium sp.]|jgi:hypothetical protein|uniref:hypothetical protein n=1 Tax=Clostridium sp. TaxID=1506 RepID=UPI0025C166A2|nr:hypothetical protein [Clostridium sp.]MCH3965466.1 hypothetical protein [Clostridium sp.]MCI2202806.1 hypothetical protein [Clostridium sp.]